MADIDRLSRKVPCLCKVSPSQPDVHMEDVHRAGGIMAILGELNRARLINRACPTVHSASLAEAIDRWDICRNDDAEIQKFYRAAPGGKRTTGAFSQDRYWDTLDADRAKGAIPRCGSCFLQGWRTGRFVRQSGRGRLHRKNRRESMRRNLTFSGPAVICESQEEAVSKILGGQIKTGDVVVIRYEGSQRGTRHAGDALPDQLFEKRRVGQVLPP